LVMEFSPVDMAQAVVLLGYPRLDNGIERPAMRSNQV
jgi:hypothetical protein